MSNIRNKHLYYITKDGDIKSAIGMHSTYLVSFGSQGQGRKSIERDLQLKNNLFYRDLTMDLDVLSDSITKMLKLLECGSDTDEWLAAEWNTSVILTADYHITRYGNIDLCHRCVINYRYFWDESMRNTILEMRKSIPNEEEGILDKYDLSNPTPYFINKIKENFTMSNTLNDSKVLIQKFNGLVVDTRAVIDREFNSYRLKLNVNTKDVYLHFEKASDLYKALTLLWHRVDTFLVKYGIVRKNEVLNVHYSLNSNSVTTNEDNINDEQ